MTARTVAQGQTSSSHEHQTLSPRLNQFTVDVVVVALAEPGRTLLTGDRADIEALATHARKVMVETI